MSHDATPGPVVRRLAREYGWLLAAVGLGALVLVCSIPFVSGAGLTWSSAEPLLAPAQVAPPAGSAPAAVPETGGPPTSAAPTATASPAVARTTKPPVTRRPAARTSPTPPRTTAPPAPAAPRAAVALGPDGGPMGLWQMLREYCEREFQTWEAQLRYGTGRAEDNWECRRHGEHPLIDMHAACRGRYGGAAFAKFADRNDAFSWHCYRR